MNTYTSLKRFGITSLFAVVLFAAFNSPLHAQGFPTVHCDSQGGSNLQIKIDAGGDGDKIFLTGVCDDGPYFIFGKHIELIGFASTGATLSSLGSGDVLIVRGATVVLRNLTIDADGSGTGILIEGSSADINSVVVQDASGAGMTIDGSSYAIVGDSEFNNNDVGIVVIGSSNAFIHQSTIQGNSSRGVVVVGASSASISNSTLINNLVGVLVTKMSTLGLGGNLIENNTETGVQVADQYGFLEAAVNTIQGNGTDVVCEARGIFESGVAQISNTQTTALSGCTLLGLGTVF